MPKPLVSTNEKSTRRCARGADRPVDHATLRRYLVDYGLLSRADGEYWRSGGWVDVFD